MKQNKVVIIGAGLGGLQCGYILAKKGFEVTILEQDYVTGGCLQTFSRQRTTFDTGFHYIGALDEGEALHALFSYFDLMSLPWKRLDSECFDEVVIGGESFAFANGHDRFCETLADRFPHEKAGLQKYVAMLKKVGDNIFDRLQPSEKDTFYSTSLFSMSAYKFLQETIQDPLLQKVLSGTSLKMELAATTLPLYTFAQINDSFIRSAWRLQGGGSLISDKLVQSITQMGGVVKTRIAVTSIEEREGKVAGVKTADGNFYAADYVISNAHPAVTVSLMGESRTMRNIYRRRIKSLQNTFGMFTANILLKKDSMPYINRNIFVHRSDADLWNIDLSRTESVMVSMPASDDATSYAASIDLLSPMSWSDVEAWADAPKGHRGESYVAFKQSKTEQCLQLVEKYVPGLRDAIEYVYTSTPLTYARYTSTAQGSAYGIRKDYNNAMFTVLTSRTPVEGLLQTGQNLNLHGVMGVSMTSLFTCAEVVGIDAIQNELKEFIKK